MKVIFEKEAICSAVVPLMSGISTKNTIPATECILMEATSDGRCVMTTYDTEKGARIVIEATVLEAGAYLVNATKFAHTVRAMDGENITLVIDGKNCVTISAGKSSHTMSALPASDFPEIPRLTSEHGFTVNAKVFRSMIAKCMFAMGINDMRAILNGMYFQIDGNQLSLVSCDTFKIAVCSTLTDMKNLNQSRTDAYKFIVPNRSVGEIYKLIAGIDEDVSVFLTRKSVVLSFENMTFFSKIIEGEYMDYNRVIDRSHRISVHVDREDFLAALERVALVTEEKSGSSHVKLTTADGVLQISAMSNTGSAYDEISADIDGQDIVIAFNNRYLMDSLRACTAERIKLSLSGPHASMNIQPADPETEDRAGDSELFMILPVRMKN